MEPKLHSGGGGDAELTPTGVAERLLSDLKGHATVVAAMGSQQPDRLIGELIAVARTRGIGLTLMVADLDGRFGFLGEALADLAAGRLRIVSLAGSVPRHLAPSTDYLNHSLWDIDRMLQSGDLPTDIFVARVTATPDPDLVGLGEMVGYTPSLLREGVAVGFEVSPGQLIIGAPVVQLDRARAFYRAEMGEPLPQRSPLKLDRTQLETARCVATLVADGATLQFGLGAIPVAVIAALRERKDLGLHSGILPAEIRKLLDGPIFNGSRKSDGKGLHVATGVLDGDPALPASSWGSRVRLEPLAVTHSPQQLLKQERLWAINSAFEVDLAGQVNAEFVGGLRLVSAGGQTDFVRAGHISRGGGSVIALPSRTTNGRPRILPRLPHPHITSTGTEVDYVVTEFGIAELRGAAAGDRAERLIAVAHPDDRDALRRERA